MNHSWNKIIKYSLPLTLIGIVEILIVMIDIFWSKIFINDIQALSAIRIVFSYLLLMEGVGIGFSSALIIYMSQKYHEQRLDQSVKAFNTLFNFNLLIGITMGVLGLLLLPLIGKLFQVNDEILIFARQYATPMLVGFVILSLANFMIVLPRYFSKLKLIYIGLVIIIVSNLIISPSLVLIFQKFGYNEMSAIALGTVIANFLMMLYLIYKIVVKNEFNLFSAKNLFKIKIDFTLIKENFGFIFSQIFNGFTFNLSMFLYLVILSFYPDQAFNIYSMGSYLFMLLGIFAQNFSASVIPLVPEYKAKKEIQSLKALIHKMIGVLIVYTGIIGIGVLIFVNFFSIQWFDGLDLNYFKKFINIYTIPWMLGTISMLFILINAGSGDAKGSMYLVISNMYVIVIVSLVIIPRFFSDQIFGVFMALSIIQVLTFINSFLFYKSGRWTKNYFL